jgi:hypothetical protein
MTFFIEGDYGGIMKATAYLANYDRFDIFNIIMSLGFESATNSSESEKSGKLESPENDWPWMELGMLALYLKILARRIAADQHEEAQRKIREMINDNLGVIEKDRNKLGKALNYLDNRQSILLGLNDLLTATYSGNEDWQGRIKATVLPLFWEKIGMLQEAAEEERVFSGQAARALVNISIVAPDNESVVGREAMSRAREYFSSRIESTFNLVESLLSGGIEKNEAQVVSQVFSLEALTFHSNSQETRARAIEFIARGFINKPEPAAWAFDDLVETVLRRTLIAETRKDDRGRDVGLDIKIDEPGLSIVSKICEIMKIDKDFVLEGWTKTDYSYPTRIPYVAEQWSIYRGSLSIFAILNATPPRCS